MSKKQEQKRVGRRDDLKENVQKKIKKDQQAEDDSAEYEVNGNGQENEDVLEDDGELTSQHSSIDLDEYLKQRENIKVGKNQSDDEEEDEEEDEDEDEDDDDDEDEDDEDEDDDEEEDEEGDEEGDDVVKTSKQPIQKIPKGTQYLGLIQDVKQ